MTKTKIWRLLESPTADNVALLVEKNILQPEEAREIIFREEDQQDRDMASLKEEVKFLRKLVEDLSKNNTKQVVEYVYKHEYRNKPWYEPYAVWCSSGSNSLQGFATAGVGGVSNTNAVNFSSIKTF